MMSYYILFVGKSGKFDVSVIYIQGIFFPQYSISQQRIHLKLCETYVLNKYVAILISSYSYSI